jgi:hypothetical protein
MYKLTFYVPDSHLDAVKTAIFAAGAGRIGNYEACSWQVRGVGQFRPMSGAQPFIGQLDTLETVDKWRVECVVDDTLIHTVIDALKGAHPYETPAFDAVHIAFS